MPKQTPKLNPKWVKEAKDYFVKFLRITKFPHPVRNGSRGSEFDYPEWLIMFIAVLAVKAKAKNYLAIHRLTHAYWDIIAEGLKLKPIPETTLRYRLKKSAIRLEPLQSLLLKYFLKDSSINIVSCDKMMIKARGPVWHQKQKKQNIMPEKLHGVDREATWGKSAAKGWIYGHGTFSIVTHDIPMLGLFVWMPNSGNEAKRMEQEIIKYRNLVKIACMDSKADDSEFYFNLQKNYEMQLLTKARKRMNKTPLRKLMIKQMATRKFKKIYQQRSTTVEPMQGLVDNIFDLETSWMRGENNNRWLFAAMGVAVQMAQLQAYKNHQSTWNIKSLVLGT